MLNCTWKKKTYDELFNDGCELRYAVEYIHYTIMCRYNDGIFRERSQIHKYIIVAYFELKFEVLFIYFLMNVCAVEIEYKPNTTLPIVHFHRQAKVKMQMNYASFFFIW